jgi:hypothetical protein
MLATLGVAFVTVVRIPKRQSSVRVIVPDEPSLPGKVIMVVTVEASLSAEVSELPSTIFFPQPAIIIAAVRTEAAPLNNPFFIVFPPSLYD